MGLDFLCIGSTRSGTTFLHHHLRAHPRVWLPPQKEIHYLSYQRAEGFGNTKHRKHLRRALPRLVDAFHGKRGALAELGWQARYLLGPRNDRWFRSLYDVSGGFVCGQIEPTYATIPSDVIREAAPLLAETKLLFMMRDPIERAWSSVTKSTAKNRDRPMAEVTEAEMHEKLQRSALRKSRYIEHIERWEEIFPKERFFFGFFDDIENDPIGFLGAVCAFLDIEPIVGLDAETIRPVNDTRRFKVSIPPHIEHFLAEELLEPTRALERRFGGHTRAWRERMQHVLAGKA